MDQVIQLASADPSAKSAAVNVPEVRHVPADTHCLNWGVASMLAVSTVGNGRV